MATVAIICEYNPFHSGHEYHIKAIKKEFGNDTCIIGIMSGSFTQRGEIAIMDKSLRARAAVDHGMSLVLELPFPFSMSNAEVFAKSAIHIINSIGTVDYLSFGSENGDLAELKSTAEAMLDKKFEDTLSSLIESGNHKEIGYPALCEMALKMAYGDGFVYAEQTPNNILALEYIKAIISLGSNIKLHTVKREGAAYSSIEIEKCEHQSATAIRNSIRDGDASALRYLPESSKNALLCAINSGAAPTDEERISSAVISSFRLNTDKYGDEIADCAGGLYNRLRACALRANSIEELIRLSETKKYTQARLRRAVYYSFFGVTSSDIKELPMYTAILATDGLGRAELKKIKNKSDFPILTKPSRLDKLPEGARRQKLLSDRADAIFEMTKPCPGEAGFSLTVTPYVKTDDSCESLTQH
ncbi:MAG: nucleotidyltransferase family protein [Clostridia bacterium]|nr:nucleotidyltransferase family protein [Clostridia bacterium]